MELNIKWVITTLVAVVIVAAVLVPLIDDASEKSVDKTTDFTNRDLTRDDLYEVTAVDADSELYYGLLNPASTTSGDSQTLYIFSGDYDLSATVTKTSDTACKLVMADGTEVDGITSSIIFFEISPLSASGVTFQIYVSADEEKEILYQTTENIGATAYVSRSGWLNIEGYTVASEPSLMAASVGDSIPTNVTYSTGGKVYTIDDSSTTAVAGLTVTDEGKITAIADGLTVIVPHSGTFHASYTSGEGGLSGTTLTVVEMIPVFLGLAIMLYVVSTFIFKREN